MNIKLAMFKPEIRPTRDVVAVLEDKGEHLVIDSLDDLSSQNSHCEIARSSSLIVLPLSLTYMKSLNEYRVYGSGADDDPGVEIYMVSNRNKYDIVRRRCSRIDTVLNDGALSLSQSCNILVACNSIDWKCDSANTRDIETVCVSNAAAIIDDLETKIVSNYRGMTVAEGVDHIESYYTSADLEKVERFSDLHDLRDANMTLPFPEDVGNSDWMAFVNTVIHAFDMKYHHAVNGDVK